MLMRLHEVVAKHVTSVDLALAMCVPGPPLHEVECTIIANGIGVLQPFPATYENGTDTLQPVHRLDTAEAHTQSEMVACARHFLTGHISHHKCKQGIQETMQ